MLRNIKRRVSKLERQLGRKESFAVIIVQRGERDEEARERHFREHPDDRERENFMYIRTIEGGKPLGGPPPRPGQEQAQDYHKEGPDTVGPLQITR